MWMAGLDQTLGTNCSERRHNGGRGPARHERLLSTDMRTAEQAHMEDELARFQSTVDVLMVRLERTLIALALTFDAQAVTRQRLNGNGRRLGFPDDTVADLQTAAEHYRRLARTLTNRARGDGGPNNGDRR